MSAAGGSKRDLWTAIEQKNERIAELVGENEKLMRETEQLARWECFCGHSPLAHDQDGACTTCNCEEFELNIKPQHILRSGIQQK